jgi:hypothetical protein
MPLLTEYSVRARPDRRVLQVYDADAYLGDDQALVASRTEVVAGNGYHLYLHSLQPDIRALVTIRIWDVMQEPPADAEGSVPVTLESETGILVVNQLTFGPAGEMTLPCPGVYSGHAWWEGRQATAGYYDECIRRGVHEHWDRKRIGLSWQQCPVQERYVLDLTFLRDPEPVDEDD